MNLTTQHINQNNEIIDFHNLSIINPSEYNFSDLDPSQGIYSYLIKKFYFLRKWLFIIL